MIGPTIAEQWEAYVAKCLKDPMLRSDPFIGIQEQAFYSGAAAAYFACATLLVPTAFPLAERQRRTVEGMLEIRDEINAYIKTLEQEEGSIREQ